MDESHSSADPSEACQAAVRVTQHRYDAALTQLALALDPVSSHGPYVGDITEDAARGLLTMLLPDTIGIGTGKVIDHCTGERKCRQVDFVAHDPRKPTFSGPGGMRFYPCEAVYLVAEIKTSISDARRLDDAVANIQNVKERQRCQSSPPAPRCLDVPGFYRKSSLDQFGDHPFGIIVAARSMQPARVAKALAAKIAPDMSGKEKMRRLPDLYVALTTGSKHPDRRGGWFMAYSEDGVEELVSPHPLRASGFVLYDREDWVRALGFLVHVMVTTAREATDALAVPLDKYMSLKEDDRFPPLQRFDWSGNAIEAETD